MGVNPSKIGEKKMTKRFFRVSGLFFAGLLLFCGPLRAQLDPRLQVGRTDFLNLYQQSASIKPKPEIVSIFDFSDSMNALMYHSLYQNLDMEEDSAGTSIIIYLQPSGSGNTLIRAGYATNVNELQVFSNIAADSLFLDFVGLVKPDGTLVTATDANNCQGLFKP